MGHRRYSDELRSPAYDRWKTASPIENEDRTEEEIDNEEEELEEIRHKKVLREMMKWNNNKETTLE